MSFDPAFAPLTEIVARIGDRRLSPMAVVERFLARIEELDPQLHAFITVTAKSARVSASAAEDALKSGRSFGPLRALPFACKDVFCTKGVRTTGGSRVLEDWVPDHDAGVVEALATAGAILIGKTNLHEFAYGATGENERFGTPPNPWDLSRMPGGSSTGSAVAVAAGLASFALGTDTGGSVRAPAALCGLVGLKPTYGLVTCYGVIPFCWSLDHVGFLTRSVADAALLLETAAGHDARDPVSVRAPCRAYGKALTGELGGLTIGVPRRHFFERVDPEILDATDAALGRAESRGARVIDVDTPDMEDARTVSLVVQMPEALSYHGTHLRTKSALYGDDLRGGFALGQFILAEHYVRAKRMMTLYRQEMSTLFERVDLLVTPTSPMIAPLRGTTAVTIDGREEALGDAHARFTYFFNLTGHPAMTLPSGWHSKGLPMGVQLIARHFEEATLLRAGDAIERALDLPIRRPSLS